VTEHPLAAALAATHARAFSSLRPWSAPEFALLLASPAMILCGDARAFVLGRVTLDEAEVLTVATDPDHRRRGLARTALAAFDARAETRGATSAFLEVAEDNIAATLLYKGAGYAEVGRRPGYYRDDAGKAVAALILRKALCAT
jgi:[ribosomal protein S18]-alanine N-acetyltransferase